MPKCNQCGNEDWQSRVEKPKACPRCKRYDWAEAKKGGGSSVVEQRGTVTAKAVSTTPSVAGSNPAPRSKTEFGAIATSIEAMLAERASREEIPAPVCAGCESPMRESKGKWACVDQACGMCGVEQKARKR